MKTDRKNRFVNTKKCSDSSQVRPMHTASGQLLMIALQKFVKSFSAAEIISCCVIAILLIMPPLAFGEAACSTEAAVEVQIKPEEIREKIRDIRLPGDKMQTLAFDMRMTLPLPLDLICFLRYEAPENYSLKVFDTVDKTPIMIIAGNMAMINDPLADQISLVASCGVTFELLPADDQYNANFAFTTPSDGKITNRVELDFKTLFSRVSKDLKLEKRPDGRMCFSGTSEQNSVCHALIDLQNDFILKALSMSVAENPVPVLRFTKIELDQPVASESFVFPMAALEASGLKFSISQPQGIIDTMLVVTTVIKAVFARTAIKRPQAREKIEAMLQTTLDWQSMESNDTARSAQLREIFKYPE